MIKALVTINNRRTLVLGLSRGNTERLLDDQPIPVDLQALLQGSTYPDVQDVVVVGGETEDAILDQFRAHGLVLPV